MQAGERLEILRLAAEVVKALADADNSTVMGLLIAKEGSGRILFDKAASVLAQAFDQLHKEGASCPTPAKS